MTDATPRRAAQIAAIIGSLVAGALLAGPAGGLEWLVGPFLGTEPDDAALARFAVGLTAMAVTVPGLLLWTWRVPRRPAGAVLTVLGTLGLAAVGLAGGLTVDRPTDAGTTVARIVTDGVAVPGLPGLVPWIVVLLVVVAVAQVAMSGRSRGPRRPTLVPVVVTMVALVPWVAQIVQAAVTVGATEIAVDRYVPALVLFTLVVVAGGLGVWWPRVLAPAAGAGAVAGICYAMASLALPASDLALPAVIAVPAVLAAVAQIALLVRTAGSADR